MRNQFGLRPQACGGPIDYDAPQWCARATDSCGGAIRRRCVRAKEPRGKAAVLFNPGEELKVADVELAPPGSREVQVRLSASGGCAGDWHTLAGAMPSPVP